MIRSNHSWFCSRQPKAFQLTKVGAESLVGKVWSWLPSEGTVTVSGPAKLIVRSNVSSVGTDQHCPFCSEAGIWAGSKHALWWRCGEGFPAELWAGELLWHKGSPHPWQGSHSLLSQWGLLSNAVVFSSPATVLIQILVLNAVGLTDWGAVSHIPSRSCFLLASGYSAASSPNLPCTTMQGHKVLLAPRHNLLLSIFSLLQSKHRCYVGGVCQPGCDLPSQQLYLCAHFYTTSAARAMVVGAPESISLHISFSISLRICCPLIYPVSHGAHVHCPPLSPLVATNSTADCVEEYFLSSALNWSLSSASCF